MIWMGWTDKWTDGWQHGQPLTCKISNTDHDFQELFAIFSNTFTHTKTYQETCQNHCNFTQNYQLIWLFMMYKPVQRKWQNTDKIWQKYISRSETLINEKDFNISKKEKPFSYIFNKLSNDTKYIAIWPTGRWLVTESLIFLLKS